MTPRRAILASVAALLVAAMPVAGQSPTPVTDEPELDPWTGSWRQEAVLPLRPRTGASVAVLQPTVRHGVLIWGGTATDGRLLADGLRIDGRDPTDVEPIPAAPIVGRREHAWAATGGNVYVWGGLDQDGEPLADGAQLSSLEPSNTWTTLPDAPLPGGPASATIVDGELFVVTTDQGTGGAVLASIRVPVESGRGWSPAVTVPLTPGDRYDVVGCCHEEDSWLFVFSLDAQGVATAAALDLVRDDWTEVGPVPVPALPAAGPVQGRTTEDDLAAWMGPVAGGEEDAAVVLSLRHPDEPWVVASAPGRTVPSGTGPLVLAPSHLVDVPAMQALDLLRGQWLRIPEPGTEDTSAPRMVGGPAWWYQGRLWATTGVPTEDGGTELWSFRPKPPEGTYALPTGRRSFLEGQAPCVLAGRRGTWRLRGDPDHPRLVWLQRGRRRAYIDWPEGWHVRFEPRLVITDSAGEIRYRGGQTCPAVTGTGG